MYVCMKCACGWRTECCECDMGTDSDYESTPPYDGPDTPPHRPFSSALPGRAPPADLPACDLDEFFNAQSGTQMNYVTWKYKHDLKFWTPEKKVQKQK